jgi:hypothetical protein
MEKAVVVSAIFLFVTSIPMFAASAKKAVVGTAIHASTPVKLAVVDAPVGSAGINVPAATMLLPVPPKGAVRKISGINVDRESSAHVPTGTPASVDLKDAHKLLPRH